MCLILEKCGWVHGSKQTLFGEIKEKPRNTVTDNAVHAPGKHPYAASYRGLGTAQPLNYH
jgi:hypothetical protein